MNFEWKMCELLFVWYDSLCPIKTLSVIKGPVFRGWTSTKLGLMFLLKDKTQWCWWGSNPQPLSLESSTLPLSHCAPKCVNWINEREKEKVGQYIQTSHASGDFCHLLITLQTVWTHIRPDVKFCLCWCFTSQSTNFQSYWHSGSVCS